ncbi:MAG TPA: peptide chain release factor-like protein, partial [Hyphomicrobiaceae bacterium]|nr:peptide chain release factor-like protein [Hyphomicrobiaceae bacterium]
KRKNWFVGVDLVGMPSGRGSRRIDARDVTFSTMRAGGAGGQHVNKTESAVRALHRPSGLVAEAREERSQHMNRRLALARLADLLARGVAAAAAEADRSRWTEHDRLERGNPTRTFQGPDFDPA